MVFWTTGKITRSFRNQEFFSDFNWDIFEPGDLVWLEDYEGKDQTRIVGVYLKTKEGNPVVRLLPNYVGEKIARFTYLENITKAPNSYWQQFGRKLLAEAS